MRSQDAARPEFIWLPSLRVWMSAPSSTTPAPADISPSSRPAPAKRESEQERDKRRLHDSLDEAGTSEDSCEGAACAICLSPMVQGRISVLCWCMHSFCTNCIQEWSQVQRFCPLCKAEFSGWYYNIQGVERYEMKQFPTLARTSATQLHRPRIHRRCPVWERRGRVSVENTAKASLRWRASIYERGLEALPPRFPRSQRPRTPAQHIAALARADRRLEPWIRRELEAVLGDPEPTVLLHLVLSLWRKSQELSQVVAEGSSQGEALWEDTMVAELQRFLGEKTVTFCHELRCFAQSPFTVQAYDKAVIYRKKRKFADGVGRKASK